MIDPSAPLPQPPMDSERLDWRPFTSYDAAALVAIAAAAPDISNCTLAFPHPLTPLGAAQWIDRLAGERDRGEAVTFALERRLDKRVIGAASARPRLAGQAVDLGYWIASEARGQGYALEALGRLCRFAFETLDAPFALCASRPHNIASQQLQAKLGFRPWGREEVEEFDGALAAALLARLARDDWRAVWNARRTVLVAACALIDADGRVLLAERPAGKSLAGHWEFPGGKVEPGETPEAALIRELREELGIDVSASCLAPFTFASHAYADFHLLMPLFVCRVWRGAVRPLEGQNLRWVRPAKLQELPLPPADKPLAAMLRDFL